MSNLGPLLTTYVPGPGCDDTLYGKIYSSLSVREKYHSLGQTDTTSCYPASFAAPNHWYSPGICPSAWSSACGSVVSSDATTETRVTCCPRLVDVPVLAVNRVHAMVVMEKSANKYGKIVATSAQHQPTALGTPSPAAGSTSSLSRSSSRKLMARKRTTWRPRSVAPF